MLTNTFNKKKVRLYCMWSLAFSFFLPGCTENKKTDIPVTIHWKDNRAESIIIPMKILDGIPHDSIAQILHIHVAKSNMPILGDISFMDGAVRFQPVIPFTRGMRYEVRSTDKVLNEFEIPKGDTGNLPMITSIHPSSRVLPQNLLKIYVAFSKPMREGEALNNIIVIRNHKDTIPVFLDLDHELWNKDGTILTLWLDPGRTKRDLQPNIKLGSPLEQGSSYQLVVKDEWRDADGLPLATSYHKEFLVGLRDSLSPNPVRWTIHEPKPGDSQPLKIDLHESLDYVLLKNAIRIVDAKGTVINGTIIPGAEETELYFTPSASWRPGDYVIEIESRLEDLAGNNLNRLFDRDLTKTTPPKQKDIYRISFHIK